MYRCNIVPRPNQIQPREGFFTIPREGRIEDFVTRMIDTRLSGAESYRVAGSARRGLQSAPHAARAVLRDAVGQATHSH